VLISSCEVGVGVGGNGFSEPRLLGRLGRGLGVDSILLAVRGVRFASAGSGSVIARGVGGSTLIAGIFATTIVVLIEFEGGGEGPLFENIGREAILTVLPAAVDFATSSEYRGKEVISKLACHCLWKS
jgi:hypothetical protein